MPDVNDITRYGQGVADLIGPAGAAQGKSVNNQQVFAPGTDNQVYQYLQLDNSLYDFGLRYVAAVADGEAMPMAAVAAPSTDPSGGTGTGNGNPGDPYQNKPGEVYYS
jgi:hypothetical protein